MMNLDSLLGGIYGISIVNEEFEKRINRIASRCDQEGIDYDTRSKMDGLMITFPWCDGDVACHSGTYQSYDGMVESYNFPWDEGDVTVLDPDTMAERIVMYYKNRDTNIEDYPQ